MHEVSICQGIINSLEMELDEGKLDQVREVYLKVGILSCIEPVILNNVFSIMIEDTYLKRAVLYIETVEVLAECGECNKQVKVEKYMFVCPDCGNPLSNIIEGNELRIYKIVLEEPIEERIEG